MTSRAKGPLAIKQSNPVPEYGGRGGDLSNSVQEGGVVRSPWQHASVALRVLGVQLQPLRWREKLGRRLVFCPRQQGAVLSSHHCRAKGGQGMLLPL